MSTSTIAVVGDDVVIEFSFTDIETDELADPDLVTVIHRDPFLVETAYVFGTDSEISQLGPGQYSFTMRIPEQHRRHYFRTMGSGEVNKAREVYVDVEESHYLDPFNDDV